MLSKKGDDAFEMAFKMYCSISSDPRPFAQKPKLKKVKPDLLDIQWHKKVRIVDDFEAKAGDSSRESQILAASMAPERPPCVDLYVSELPSDCQMNGLIHALSIAYNLHGTIVLHPRDLFYASYHGFVKALRLGGMGGDSSGEKKHLVVKECDSHLMDAPEKFARKTDLSLLFGQLCGVMDEICSEPVLRQCAAIATCAESQPFYTFTVEEACGFRGVVMDGSFEQWERLLVATDAMYEWFTDQLFLHEKRGRLFVDPDAKNEILCWFQYLRTHVQWMIQEYDREEVDDGPCLCASVWKDMFRKHDMYNEHPLIDGWIVRMLFPVVFRDRAIKEGTREEVYTRTYLDSIVEEGVEKGAEDGDKAEGVKVAKGVPRDCFATRAAFHADYKRNDGSVQDVEYTAGHGLPLMTILAGGRQVFITPSLVADSRVTRSETE